MKRMIAAICAAMMLCGLAGCGTATMPDVTGMSITDARSKLNSAGFYSVDVKDMNGKAAFDGKIQSQKPKAGKEASTSDQVELVVKSTADQAQEAVNASKKLKQTAEDVKGKDAVEAIKTLQNMSAVGSIKDKNGADVSEQRITDDEANGVKWVVTDASAHTITSQTIDLVVDTEANMAAAQAQEQQKQQLEQKLSTTAALAACREYGKQLYPYGFKTHDIAGVIQDFTPSDENTWFYKATADVTNAFGAKQKGLTYECSVTGTTDAPQVVDFNVY